MTCDERVVLHRVGREPPNDKLDPKAHDKLGRGASDGKAKKGKAAAMWPGLGIKDYRVARAWD